MTYQLDRRRLMQWLGLAPAVAAPRTPAIAARPAVCLLFTRINGERYYDAEAVFASLAVGAPVTLRREPDNAHDPPRDRGVRRRRPQARLCRADRQQRGGADDRRFEARVARLTPPLDIRVTVDWVPG